jgi:hypothetical protein
MDWSSEEYYQDLSEVKQQIVYRSFLICKYSNSLDSIMVV